MGDMGNWTVVAGAVDQTKSLDIIALTGGGSIIGRGVIFHGVSDDCTTQPAGGNAPPRWAQCVIGLAAPGAGDNNAAIAGDGATAAVCVLSGTTGNTGITGTIYFDQATAASPVRVYGSISGLDGNPHGFHIHEFGDISNATGGAAGSHYNPLAANHGIPPFAVRHIGDMGNIYHYVTNVAYYDYTNNLMSLGGEYSILGHTVIVHAAPDDCTMPVGNAGSRLAQCVIGVRNPATVPITLPNGVPTTQDPAACEALYPATSATEEGSMAVSTHSIGFAVIVLAAIFAALF
jgi:Cu-Zn family superoxide dismutase